MIRMLNFLLVISVIGLSAVLYGIKYHAEAAERRSDDLARQIASEQDGIRVLRAEWSYLNQPERLQNLAKRYTELVPLTPSQISSFNDIPVPHKADDFYAPGMRKPLGGYAGVVPQDLGASARTIQ